MTTSPGDQTAPETVPFETEAMPSDAMPSAATRTAASAAPRRRPRFAPICWGIVLLSFAAYVVVARLLPTPPDPTFWLLGGIIAVGLTLVVAGIAAAARRAG